VLLVVFAARTGNPRIISGYAVFGSTLVILFSVSSVFHGLVVGRAKQVMEIMDYSAIYLLIAGSYTAFCFTALKGASTWILFSAAWTIAVIGIVAILAGGVAIIVLGVIANLVGEAFTSIECFVA